jgi:hypothetical protein
MDRTAVHVMCAETRSKLLKGHAHKNRDMLAMLRAVIPPVGDRRSWDCNGSVENKIESLMDNR